MATDDEQWWEAQAGEYALGTLRGTERDVFEKIMASDASVVDRVKWWQEKLSALNSRIEAVEPPPHLLPIIMSRIAEETIREKKIDGELHNIAGQPDITDAINGRRHRSRRSRRRIRVWQSVAGLATAAAVGLAVVLLQVTSRQAPSAPLSSVGQIVSVLQSDADQQNMWLLSVNESDGQVQVLALAPPPIEADRSFELWVAKPDDAGVSSVGLLPTSAGDVDYLTLPISASDARLFAVSVEPTGGSPEDGPTGPVLGYGSIYDVETSGL